MPPKAKQSFVAAWKWIRFQQWAICFWGSRCMCRTVRLRRRRARAQPFCASLIWQPPISCWRMCTDASASTPRCGRIWTRICDSNRQARQATALAECANPYKSFCREWTSPLSPLLNPKLLAIIRVSGVEKICRAVGLLRVAVALGPPLAPDARVIVKWFTGDSAQCAINPAARGGVKRIVIEQIQQIRNRGEALLLGQQAGFGQAAGGSLAGARRRIAAQDVEQGIDGRVGGEHGQSLDSPVARVLIPMVRVAKQSGENRFRLDPTAAQSGESPQGERAADGIRVDNLHELHDALRCLVQIVRREVDFHCGVANA